MSQQQQTQNLTTVLSEVLADLAFMFTDDETSELVPGSFWLESTIGYDGPVKGTLRLWCTEQFAATLAANLLGRESVSEDDKGRAEAADAVKEFMNVLCGQFVTTHFGTDHVFNITIPEIRGSDTTPDFFTDNADDTAALSVEGHLIQLRHTPGE